MANRLHTFDTLLSQLDSRSTVMGETVKGLLESLEFSQKEITDLKKENADLKKLIGNLEIEDRRTQFQMQDIVDKVNKLDTMTKRKNLVIEGGS